MRPSSYLLGRLSLWYLNSSNVRRFFLALLLACALIVGGVFLYSLVVSVRQERRHMRELTVQSKSRALSASAGQQELCARQALKAYTSDRAAAARMGAVHDVAAYTDHFNGKLNKCFVEIKVTGLRPPSTSISVIDAFAGGEYATYVDLNPQGTTNPERRQAICAVFMPSGQKQYCRSSREFSELIKQYMEE